MANSQNSQVMPLEGAFTTAEGAAGSGKINCYEKRKGGQQGAAKCFLLHVHTQALINHNANSGFHAQLNLI